MTIHLQLDRESASPLYQQMAEEIVRLVGAGRLAPGERLPSVRDLASELGVNRNTVAQAYDTLARDGVVTRGVGRGTFIRERGDIALDPPRRQIGRAPDSRVETNGREDTRHPTFDWPRRLGPRLAEKTRHVLSTLQSPPTSSKVIAFSRATPDPDLFPTDEILALARDVLEKRSSLLFEYGPSPGHPPLRELLMERLAARGVCPDTTEILILNGSSQGLDLVARVLLHPGSRVGLEVPTYSGALNTFSLHDVEPVPAWVDEHGLRVEDLEAAARSGGLELVYTMPSFHNPCGTTLPLSRRHQLLDLAREQEIPVFEDDPEGELRFEGVELPMLKALDTADNVITSGTFSKIAFPGFRIGWLAVPRSLFEHVLALKTTTDISSNAFPQVLFHEFLRRGLLEEHIERIKPVYRKRRDAMIEALDEHLPDGVTFTRPEGGLVLWLDLPRGVSARSLLRRTARRGVLFSPGDLFVPTGTREGLRLSYASVKKTAIERGVRILAEELRNEMVEVAAGPSERPDLASGLPLV
jgi:GntR family transcriptional regulator/MocR family aminotransferase